MVTAVVIQTIITIIMVIEATISVPKRNAGIKKSVCGANIMATTTGRKEKFAAGSIIDPLLKLSVLNK
ncbi:MAG: hypothetical protein JKY49_09260 [Cohaesibacteraceae bacterium]|nr:hypothetical protein [Cohaesibacteraceae bacterium]